MLKRFLRTRVALAFNLNIVQIPSKRETPRIKTKIMSQKQFTGYGGSLEEAISAAGEEALKSWKPAGPDDMLRLEIGSMSLLYGGIVGHTGTRVANVSLAGRLVAALAGPSKAELSLKLTVVPEVVYANLMPPIRRPQPYKIHMLLLVTNNGTADYEGQSPDTAVARFAILRGRTVIWKWPEFAGQVVTPLKIRPSESLPFTAEWEMADAIDFANAELHAVARFVPSGDSAMQEIEVRPVF